MCTNMSAVVHLKMGRHGEDPDSGEMNAVHFLFGIIDLQVTIVELNSDEKRLIMRDVMIGVSTVQLHRSHA